VTACSSAFGASCFAALSLIASTALAGDRHDPVSSAPPSELNALPGDSLYRLPVTLTTAAGVSMQLSELRGKPLIVTMFYSQCASVCPLLTSQLQRLLGRLSPDERRQTHVLMVSFDSVRDTPAALTEFAAQHRITEQNWVVARASMSDVRLLAAALGIQFRELPDHTFNHSAVISVADRNGTVRARTSELNDLDGTFLTQLRAQVQRELPH
jgi:protein SCO1